MSRSVRRLSGELRRPLLVALGCGLILALAGCSRSEGTAAAASRSGSTYTLMQMNLCLSGLAGCYARVEYPAVVNEAVARIRQAHPDAVTFNEACRADVALHPADRISRPILGGYLLRQTPALHQTGRPRTIR